MAKVLHGIAGVAMGLVTVAHGVLAPFLHREGHPPPDPYLSASSWAPDGPHIPEPPSQPLRYREMAIAAGTVGSNPLIRPLAAGGSAAGGAAFEAFLASWQDEDN